MCSAQGHVRFTPNSDIDCAFRRSSPQGVSDREGRTQSVAGFIADHLQFPRKLVRLAGVLGCCGRRLAGRKPKRCHRPCDPEFDSGIATKAERGDQRAVRASQVVRRCRFDAERLADVAHRRRQLNHGTTGASK
jgi:hypothetical protein